MNNVLTVKENTVKPLEQILYFWDWVEEVIIFMKSPVRPLFQIYKRYFGFAQKRIFENHHLCSCWDQQNNVKKLIQIYEENMRI